MSKIEKTPSGKYRCRRMIQGKSYCLTFDHRPTKKEIDDAIKDMSKDYGSSFCAAAETYIVSKKDILSPSTIRSYRSMLRSLPEDFMSKDIGQITTLDIQQLLNDISATHAPKTAHNVYGLISAVLGVFRPEATFYITLPQKRQNEAYIPTDEEVRKILEVAKDTRYYTPLCLGCLGLRLSEVMALTPGSLDGNILSVDKALVRGENGMVLKGTKTPQSVRQIQLPDTLVQRIQKDGYIYEGSPDKVNAYLTRVQRQLGIKHFSFHKLRHYFASMAHSDLQLSDSTICSLGGWKQNSSVMKTVYRHAVSDKVIEAQKDVANKFGKLF